MLSKINESNPLWLIIDIVSGKIIINIHIIIIVTQYAISLVSD